MNVGEESESPPCCACWILGITLKCLVAVVVILTVLWQTRFKYHVKMFLYLQCLIVGGILGGLASIPFGRTTNNHYRMFRIFQFLCSFLHLEFTIRNEERLESSQPYIIIANHQSCIDVLGMSYVWPKNCVVMLKSSLRWLPGFNLCAYYCNSIYINRFSKDKAFKTLDKTLAAISDNNYKVWIYPEGTRNPESTLLPFKKGAFLLAHQAKIPIVCCVFSTHKFFYDWAARRFDDSGRVLVNILPPIDSSSFDSVDALTEHCRTVIQTEFNRLNSEMESLENKKAN